MQKSIIAITLAALSAVAPFSASADSSQSCGTVLCLGGSMLGGKGGSMCEQPIQDYFDIKKYRKKKFSPSRTFQARQDYLDECESENEGNKARIQAKYGMLENNPGF